MRKCQEINACGETPGQCKIAYMITLSPANKGITAVHFTTALPWLYFFQLSSTCAGKIGRL